MTKYVGARYMPKFMEEHNPSQAYEALSVVDNGMGTTYVSNKPVPPGIPLTNSEYWAVYGVSNGAIINLQNQIDAINRELTQTKNDLDVNFLNHPFVAQRYGSIAEQYYAQCAMYYEHSFYIAGDRQTTTGFRILKTNANLVTENEYVYDENVHPNAIMAIDDFIYVIDSRNHDIYKIDPSNMSIMETITSLENYLIAGAFYSDDKVYFIGGMDIIITDKAFSIQNTITLEDYPASDNGLLVRQGIFVLDGHIYVVLNRPNALAIYDMDGHLIGIKLFEKGDGYYPFGEVEDFFEYQGDIYMLCGYYYYYKDIAAGTDILQQLSAIFKTNLINPILNSNPYGQATPTPQDINVDASATKATNPDGTASKPFTKLFEAGLVANYLATNDANGVKALVLSGTFTDDVLALTDCNMTIYSAGSVSVPAMDLWNVNAVIRGGSFANITCHDSKVSSVAPVSITNINANTCVLDLDSATISGKVNLSQVQLGDSCKITSNSSDISISNVNQPCHKTVRQGTNAWSHSPVAFSDFFKSLVMNSYRTRNTVIRGTLVINTSNGAVRLPIAMEISNQTKNAIYSDPTHEETAYFGGRASYNGTTAVDVLITYKITASGITYVSGTIGGVAIGTYEAYLYDFIAETYLN